MPLAKGLTRPARPAYRHACHHASSHIAKKQRPDPDLLCSALPFCIELPIPEPEKIPPLALSAYNTSRSRCVADDSPQPSPRPCGTDLPFGLGKRLAGTDFMQMAPCTGADKPLAPQHPRHFVAWRRLDMPVKPLECRFENRHESTTAMHAHR